MGGTNGQPWRRMGMIMGGALVLAVGGCGDLFGSNDFALTISSSEDEVAADAPVTLTITAMNLGDPVVWGQGSSSCQLDAVIHVGLDEFRIGTRGCTDDLVPQGLGRGESRTEQWDWNGTVFDGATLDTLPPGEYVIRAVAGALERSEPRTIRVTAPQQ